MTARGHYNGHETMWVYAADKEPVEDPRPCPLCGRLPDETGDDSCLGRIPGVKAACCGHGVKPGYVLTDDDRYVELPTLTPETLPRAREIAIAAIEQAILDELRIFEEDMKRETQQIFKQEEQR